MDRHGGMVPDDPLDEIRRHSGRQPQRLDPAVLRPQTTGSRDDPAPAGDHREDMAAAWVVADELLRAVGVEAARAVRGRAAMRRAVLSQATCCVGAVVPALGREQGVQPTIRTDPERAQCPDLAHLWLEATIGVHRRLLCRGRLPVRLRSLRRGRLRSRLGYWKDLDTADFLADVPHGKSVDPRSGIGVRSAIPTENHDGRHHHRGTGPAALKAQGHVVPVRHLLRTCSPTSARSVPRRVPSCRVQREIPLPS